MSDRPSGLDALQPVADYQFGPGAGAALFEGGTFEVERSRSGRPRQIRADGARVATLLTDGRLSLGVEGGRRLARALEPPTYRVTVGDESEPYVREGRNVFAKFVGEVDPAVRRGDEVLVVHEDGRLLAVGRAELGADAMAVFGTGMAVQVREGVGSE